MSSIYMCGGVGGTIGAALGAWLGGLPGAATLGQLGAGAGLEIGKWVFGADLGKHVVEVVLDKTIRAVERAEKIFLSVGLPCGVYWQVSKSMQEACTSSQDLACEAYKWTNVAVLLCSAGTALYVVKQVSSKFVSPEPVRIVQRETFSDNNTARSIHSRMAEGVSALSRKSKEGSKKLCSS